MPPSSRNCAGAVIAVDTDIVVRLLTGDDAAQLEHVRRLFEVEIILLPKTVVLETEWVLRCLYGLPPSDIVRALLGLVALPQVRCEDATAVSAALDLVRQNLDFADALHLVSSSAVQRFATFDRALVRRAKAAATRIAVSAP
jgi:predicted nucleic-acid-binding protein